MSSLPASRPAPEPAPVVPPTPTGDPSSAANARPAHSGGRAIPLASAPAPHTRRGRGAAAALVLALLAGCGAEGEADAADRAPDRRDHPLLAEQTIGDLVVAFTPPAQTASSAVQDDWLRRRRAILERLRDRRDEDLGELLLDAFQTREGDPVPVRSGLLEAATLCAPELAAPVLDELVRNYGEDLGLRTEACRFFGEAAPEAAIETLGELLLDHARSSTAPPDEALLDGWLRAHRALGRTPGTELALLATDIQRDQATRHLAIRALGESPSKIAKSALEEVIHESSGNIYMRRLAAQSLVGIAEREEYCPVFVRVYEHEADLNFQLFLEDMIQEHCP